MSSAEGTWNVKLETPMGVQEGTMELHTDGDKLTGRLSNPQMDAELQDGAIDGDTLTWTVHAKRPRPMKLKFTATVTGDEISGTIKLGIFGTAKFEGTRVT